jgi:hypothetical protein
VVLMPDGKLIAMSLIIKRQRGEQDELMQATCMT